MSRFGDEDFEDDVVPGTEKFTESDYHNYMDEEDDDYVINKFKSIGKLAKSLSEVNSHEQENSLKKSLDVLTSVFMANRLENGLKAEDLKRKMLSRMTSILDAFTPTEIIQAYKLISDASNPDLEKMLGSGKSGININMGGPTMNNYDNSITNTQVNQIAQQTDYSNDKAIKQISQEEMKRIGNLSEISNIFKEMNLPRQNQIEYNPNEKIVTNEQKIANMIEANFKEIKEEEIKKLNED